MHPFEPQRTKRRMMMLEICVDDLAGIEAAAAGGANRIELCSVLSIGGMTPTAAFTEQAVELAHARGMAIRAMVRPRGGDFAYDDADMAMAAAEARWLASRVDGLVFGAAKDGRLDEAAMARFIEAARGVRPDIALTLHRAIDATADPAAEVEVAVRLGFDLVLTSGGAVAAPDAADVIRAMVERVGDRCRIMAGAGVRPDNVAALVAATGVRDVHGSASSPTRASDALADKLEFSPQPRRTDPDVVRGLRTAIDTLETTTA
ncbi:copper homeostasis protein [Sphingomonas jinjuensis]|uniref:PF03932 family protein CutC n=2 Tax=Sphingomonas jinjuensis TaxID=535907 RepID=A0A840FE88_9SPHN|nr:copper homeostasis protein [Sphingomonas jinjuensis]